LGGRVADAVPLLTQALEQMTAMERADFQALCLLPLGEAQMLAGHLEEAQALAERALAHAQAHQERGNQAYALRLLGDIAARREPPASDQAEDYYRQALALAGELGMRPLVAHCNLGLGTLYGRMGRSSQPVPSHRCHRAYRAMDMTFGCRRCRAGRSGRRLEIRGRGKKANATQEGPDIMQKTLTVIFDGNVSS
jgi:hypothetical protein